MKTTAVPFASHRLLRLKESPLSRGRRHRKTEPQAFDRRRSTVVGSVWRSLALAAVFCAVPAFAQKASLERGPHRLEIVLEKLRGSSWEKVDPGLVLDQGDRVRFRATTNFDGYLYVMNQGTSGDYTRLFPREDTGSQNEIKASQEYLVPSTEGAFRISGPAGHEIVYWMVSPIELGGGPEYEPLPPPPDPKRLPPNLLPRCDDTIFRARGDCVDTSAGPQPLADENRLPQNLAQVPNLSSRQLLFMKKEDSSVVSAPPALEGPVIFEFRLAHK